MSIPDSYHAVQWVDIDRLEFVQKPMPVVGAGRILLRIKTAGICGTDPNGMKSTVLYAVL